MAVMLFMTVISRAASSFTVVQVQVESPKSRAIVHKVIGDGTVTRQSDLPVYTVADILVAKVKVTEGQEVKKGQTLAVLDTDSIDEQIQTLSDEIEVLQLQNDALKSAEAKRDREQDKALSRAKEDYEDTVQSNKDAVSKAKENIKTAKKQTKKNEKKTLEDLQNSVEEAKKAYEDAVETLIFDEIDSGISGRTAQMVSEKMNVLGRSHQIICITHLPQIAAMADSHYLIRKSVQNQTTVSTIRRLSEEESIQELSRMLGGVEITETVKESAREMRALAKSKKSGFEK